MSSPLESRTRFGVFFFGLLLPLGIWGAIQGLNGMTNHPVEWINGGSSAGDDFAWFSEHFEHFDPIVVAWKDSLPDDQRIDRFVDGLTPFTTGEDPLFADIITGKDVFTAMTDGSLELSQDEAFERLYMSLMGETGETIVIVILAPDATRRTRQALEKIYDVAAQQCSLARDEVHLGGPSVESVAIDSASMRSLYQNVLPSGLAAVTVACICLRGVWLTAWVATVAGICEALALSLVYYCGSPFTGLLVVLPALVFVVFISGAVHFSNYFFDAMEDGPADQAANTALRHGLFPCTLAAGTTAVGIFSLISSQIEPVRVFAIYGGAGVLLALCMMLIILPGICERLSRRRAFRARYEQPNDAEVAQDRGQQAASSQKRDSWIVGLVQRRAWLVTLFFFAFTTVAGLGVHGLKPTMDQTDFFDHESKIMVDMRWLEDHIGPLLPYEVAIPLKADAGQFGSRVEVIQQLASKLQSLESIGSCLSVATFAPDIEPPIGIGGVIRRKTVLRELENNRIDYLETPYVAEIDSTEYWRLSLRVAMGFDHDTVLKTVERTVEDWAKTQGSLVDGSPKFTGLFVLVADSRRRLLTDLTTSFSIALVVIAIALAITFRSATLGAISIAPNIFPSLAVFGGMGWLQIDVDVGAMITASVGLGIAVDDTVHYLTWYTHGLRQGLSSAEAVAMSHRRCAAAMFRTTLICGAGLIVFCFSPLVIAARFAMLICVLLSAALVGDLLFLPAILCGPLRNWRPKN